MRTALKMIAAGVGMTASVSAFSAPLYTTWNADVRAGFTDFGPADVVGSNDMALLDGTLVPTVLSWGNPFAPNTQQSSLAVSSISPLALTTNDPTTLSGDITHNNFPITGASLDFATLTTEVALSALGLPAPIEDAITLNINFSETPNLPAGGANCEGQAIGAGVGINDQGCADIFVVDVTGAGFDNTGRIVRQLGSLGDPGFLYTAVIEITGAVPLDSATCQAAAGVSSCVGFLTGENRSNVAQTSLGIFAREIPVPAPAPILGLGLGLLMMARARRSRK